MSDELRKIRLQKLEAIKNAGQHPYPERFERTHMAEQAKGLPLDTDQVKLAGRLLTLRDMGKLTFAHLQDSSGKIQLAFQVDELGKEKYDFIFKHFDAGDFLGVTGKIFKTHKGEMSLLVSDYQFLGKALLPLPEKWHGVKDTETIYRKRYLDLIMNPESRKRFKIRANVIRTIREFLDGEGFEEVETPILATKASGALAKPFATHHNALDLDVYLRIAPETYLKRCIVGGYDKVYEIARCFRNEGMDPSHLQEFTMLEFYGAYWNFEDNMNFTERLLVQVLQKTLGTLKLTYHGTDIDFTPPWPRVKFRDLILKDSGIDIDEYADVQSLEQAIQKKKIVLEYPPGIGRANLMDVLYKKVSRPKLIDPTFVIQHPVDLKPLARRNDNDPRIADSFQLTVNTWEIVNAYSELVDPLDQRARLEEQARMQAAGDEEVMIMEEDYLEAMEHGMPPISGNGIGIDRLVSLLTDQENLRDVVLFPLMRPLELAVSNKQSAVSDPDEKTDLKGFNRGKAWKLVMQHGDEQLHYHLLSVEAAMSALAKHFGEDEETWGLVGLLHDFDYTTGMDDMEHVGEKTAQILRDAGCPEDMIYDIRSHHVVHGLPPITRRAKALFAVDELTGLIYSTALMRPTKISDMEVSSVKKKFKDKGFSSKVRRDWILTCESALGVKLEDFMKITLEAMKGVAGEIGL